MQQDLRLRADARARYERSCVAQRILEGDHPIAAWRHRSGLSCDQLAALCGIETPRIYALDHELEIPTEEELDRLAAALDAPRDMLVAPHDESDELGAIDFLA